MERAHFVSVLCPFAGSYPLRVRLHVRTEPAALCRSISGNDEDGEQKMAPGRVIRESELQKVIDDAASLRLQSNSQAICQAVIPQQRRCPITMFPPPRF